MKWTSEKPTTPGYYWYSSSRYPTQIVTVYAPLFGRSLRARVAGGGTVSVMQFSGQWSGPIPEPEEA